MSTVATVVHEGITILRERLVPEVILFLTGQELDRVLLLPAPRPLLQQQCWKVLLLSLPLIQGPMLDGL